MLDKMRILRAFTGGDSQRLSAVACRVAILCYAQLPREVVRRACAMPFTEARGYLRAHLHKTLVRQCETIGRPLRLSKRKLAVLIELTLDQLSDLCVRQSGRMAA